MGMSDFANGHASIREVYELVRESQEGLRQHFDRRCDAMDKQLNRLSQQVSSATAQTSAAMETHVHVTHPQLAQDNERSHRGLSVRIRRLGKRVAVLGTAVAGLTAAWQVFERAG